MSPTSLDSHVLRRLPLTTLGAAVLLSGGFVWAWATRRQEGVQLVGYLRCPTVVLAASAAQFLDDVGAPLLDVTPRGRARRRAVDALVALALVLAAWVAVAVVGFVLVDRADLLPDHFPWGASLLEVAALTMLGFVIMTVVAQLTGPGSGGRVALMIGVAAVGTLAISRTNAWLWPTVPSDSAWRDAHLRWAVLAAMALGTLVTLSRDPARRSLIAARRAARAHTGPVPAGAGPQRGTRTAARAGGRRTGWLGWRGRGSPPSASAGAPRHRSSR